MGKGFITEYVPYGVTHAEYQKTWAAFCAKRDIESRNQLVMWNQKLLQFTVSVYASRLPNGIRYEDVVGYAQIGLIEALEHYDPRMETAFSTYAVIMMRGSVEDGISRAMGISRRIYHRLRQEECVRERLRSTTGRDPTEEEIAFEMGIPLAIYTRFRRRTETVLQDGFGAEEVICRIGLPEASLTKKETARELRQLVEQLPDEERALLHHVIWKGESIRKAGRETGISRYRAASIYKKTIADLRRQMEKKGFYSD